MKVNKIVTVVLKKDEISSADEAYQWNYGQILRIQGNLPKAVEVHFSLEETSGTSVTRIGTTVDGVTEAPIPDSLLENNNCSQDYTIYAYIYLEDGTAGRTEYEIAIPVKARTKPEVPGTPEEPELFRETIQAVNDAADRAEQAVADTEEIRDNLNLDLSEKITRPEKAEVGQVIAVKTVDENGKPTEVEAQNPVEIPDWAKAPEKPTYTAEEVGALPADTKIPTKTSELENDSGFLTEHQDISGKLDKDKLPEAIDDALAQAKESGEFDGKDGAPGEKGDPGETTYIENPYNDTEIKEEITAKVGYSEVAGNQLLMYADDTKEKLLATIELPSSVGDVKINGESIVGDGGVAEIPMATIAPGLVKVLSSFGIGTVNSNKDGYLCLWETSEANINARANKYQPLTATTLDYAVKAAMCDGKGADWTSEEQAAARERMGAYRRDYRLIADITLEQESSMLIVEKDADGKDISLRKAKIFVFSPAPREDSKNNGYVRLNDKGIYYGAIDWKVNGKNSVTVVNIDIFGEIAPTTVEFVPAHNVSIATTRTISMSVGNILDYYNEINKITILANYYFDKGTRFIIIGKE